MKQLIDKFKLRTLYEKILHSDYTLVIISSFVGIVIGIFIVLFHSTMSFFEYIFGLFGAFSNTYFNIATLIIPLIACLGGLSIGILRKYVFKSESIEGLDRVIKAIVYEKGKIDWKNSIKSILLSAISIGSGGGAGREGPTIVLGASLGSSLARLFKLHTKEIRILCGAGAAAAISGIFNAPLGGIVFALEAMIGDVGMKGFIPLVIASVFSTATIRMILGDNALLIPPVISHLQVGDYFLLAVAGMFSGLIAYYYLKMYYSSFKITQTALKKVPDVLKPAIGGLISGMMVMFLPTLMETTYNPINYAIQWNGAKLTEHSFLSFFPNIFSGISPLTLGVIIAVLTTLLKPISNAVTLASGGSGGTFAPSIKAGAMFGFVFGYSLHFIFPGIPPGLFAMVCSAAVLSGVYQLPLSAGIIIFELSKNSEMILPLVFSSVFASFIIHKTKIKTFSALQKGLVDDEEKLHPTLKIKE